MKKFAGKHTSFKDPFMTDMSAILTLKSFLLFSCQLLSRTRTAQQVCVRLPVLDLGQNAHYAYQSPTQPRTGENDAVNNII